MSEKPLPLPPPPKFLNRELSWLEFNQRVLNEACDSSLPLLERLRFLAITASNLDEFFMVRVGGLQLLAEQGVVTEDPSGMSPVQQLGSVSQRAHQMVREQYACFAEVEGKLAEAFVRRLRVSELNERQLRGIEQLFDDEIFSVLTPMLVQPDEEFPLLVNQMLHLLVQRAPIAEGEAPRFSVIPLGKILSRLVTLGADRGYAYVLLEDVARRFIDRFFPGETIVGCASFRITRNADFGLRDDLAYDLVVGMQEILAARKHGDCVRLEIGSEASPEMLAFLKDRLAVVDESVFIADGPVDLAAFMPLADIAGFEMLRYEAWPPQPSPQIEPGASMFTTIARGDVLLYHPYESFEPVVRLIEEAAVDPDVLAIKQILYRTSRNSPIVAALARAAQRGKYVTVIVELKARFDEARNIEWARNLEEAGVQVIYGVKGLKTHAKVCVIVRREPHGIQRYVHFGTGNYNEITSRIYSDASLLTCNDELGNDAVSFFNAISGYSQPHRFHKLEAAPLGLRGKLLEMIEAETQHKKDGKDAFIFGKLNSLVDAEIIQALYHASIAGVKISLNIRGICCLCPGVPGLSDNISVISVIDRFLEHSRILHFHHGGDDRVFISSADWMPRNLDRRIELLTPVEDPEARDRLIHILKTYFEDNVKSWALQSDGSFRRSATKRRRPRRSQAELYAEACEAVQEAEQSRQTTFEPHRAPGKE